MHNPVRIRWLNIRVKSAVNCLSYQTNGDHRKEYGTDDYNIRAGDPIYQDSRCKNRHLCNVTDELLFRSSRKHQNCIQSMCATRNCASNLQTNCQKHRNVNFFLEYETVSCPTPKEPVVLKVKRSNETIRR